MVHRQLNRIDEPGRERRLVRRSLLLVESYRFIQSVVNGTMEIPHSGFWEILLWILRFRKRYRVEGMSMTPALNRREEVLVAPHAYRRREPMIGDIVVARHPFQPDCLMIKRVKAFDGEGRLFLQGDNSGESTDSRSFGWVEHHRLLGKVTSRLFSTG